MRELLILLALSFCSFLLKAQSPLEILVGYAPPPAVQANAGTDTTICEGSSVQLNAMGVGGVGQLQYNWQPTTGLSNANISNPIASPAQSTTYTLEVTDARGCFQTSTISITVVVCSKTYDPSAIGFRMYPNPTSGVLKIRWDEHFDIQEIHIRNVQGKSIRKYTNLTTRHLQIDISDMAAGIYLVEAQGPLLRTFDKLVIQ